MTAPTDFGALAGRRVRDSVPPYVWDASVDTIRNFARAYGDDNPLYSDPDYAGAGPRGGLVAPPLFPIAAGLPAADEDDDDDEGIDLAAIGRGYMQTVIADEWTLCRPVVAGVRLQRTGRLASATAVEGGWEVGVRTRYTAGDVLYAVHARLRRYLVGDRDVPPHAPVQLAQYSRADIDRIAAAYEGERPRGANIRFAEDVVVGDAVGPLMKGPLTVTDLVSYRGGVGPGPLGGEPLRLSYANRRERPALYDRDSSGAPDITERRHYDEHYAKRLGNPTAYDYSHTRLTWLSHLLTDWMGDAGWLWRLTAAMEAENYLGDMHVFTGTVTAVQVADGFGRVHIEIEGRNQREERTCGGTAVVLLPAHGSAVVTDAQLASLDSEVDA